MKQINLLSHGYCHNKHCVDSMFHFSFVTSMIVLGSRSDIVTHSVNGSSLSHPRPPSPALMDGVFCAVLGLCAVKLIIVLILNQWLPLLIM